MEEHCETLQDETSKIREHSETAKKISETLADALRYNADLEVGFAELLQENVILVARRMALEWARRQFPRVSTDLNDGMLRLEEGCRSHNLGVSFYQLKKGNRVGGGQATPLCRSFSRIVSFGTSWALPAKRVRASFVHSCTLSWKEPLNISAASIFARRSSMSARTGAWST